MYRTEGTKRSLQQAKSLLKITSIKIMFSKVFKVRYTGAIHRKLKMMQNNITEFEIGKVVRFCGVF